MTDSKVVRNKSTVKLVFEYSHVGCVHSGPDSPIGYVGLSLGPQKLANCGTYRVNYRYCMLQQVTQ